MLNAHSRIRLALIAACLGGAAVYGCAANSPPPTDEDPGEGGSDQAEGGSDGKILPGSGGKPGTGGKTQPGTGGSGGDTTSGTGGTVSTGGTPGDGGTIGSGGSSSGGDTGTDGPGADGGTTGTGGDIGGGAGGSTVPTGGPYKVVLLYSNDHNAADPSLKDMAAVLTAMKTTHNVQLEMILDSDANAKADKLGDKALVIVGPNTRACSNGVDTKIKDLAVPVMISKDCTSWSGLGNMVNTDNTLNSLKIVKSDHPLAAGLSGTVRVYTDNVCREVRGMGVSADAIKIANTPVDATSWAIFAYEKGKMMPGGMAPAKRIGFFWHRPSGATPEGKKLFTAAVEWAITP
jgi:hypothetical protein